MKSEINLAFGRELNREIVEELKNRQGFLDEREYKKFKELCNKERIKALGLTLIQGGKEE